MPHKLSDILGAKFSRKDELSKQLQIVKVFDLYREEIKKIFPQEIDIKPLSLKNKILTVEVPSSVVANELRMREEGAVNKICRELGKEIIKRIIYRF